MNERDGATDKAGDGRMQRMTGEIERLELLFEINSDRILTILMVLAALLAVGLMGAEHAGPSVVEQVRPALGGVV